MLSFVIRHYLYGFLVLFAALLGVRALESAPRPLQRFEFQEPHMGTLFRIVLYAPDEATAKVAARAAFARAEQLNRIMSDYLKDSELRVACQKAGGPPVEISQDLYDVLAAAQHISVQSEGAFDISIRPVIGLWRNARRTGQLPDPERLREALALVDFRKIVLDPRRRTLQLLLAGMLLDLGAIGKGFAADAMLEVLLRHGIRRAWVAAGGDVTVGDPPPGKAGWKVGIAPLRDPERPPTIWLVLRNAAASTSGDAEQYVEIEGKRYSHVVDPKTGIGLTGRRSVSVIARRGVWADGLDTAACVMGPERGIELLEREGVEGIYVYEEDGQERSLATKRFAKYVIAGKQ